MRRESTTSARPAPRATLYDVCRLSGVSTATVSRVLNGTAVVSEETRQRVRQAIDRLGWVPNRSARSLAGRRQGLLGVVFPDLDVGFYTEVLRGIDDIAAECDHHLVTAFSHGRLDERKLVERFIREERGDALILMNLTLEDAFLRQAAGWGMPLVLIDRPVAGSGLSVVSMDNARGIRAAVEHLLEHGYRRLAVIAGPDDNQDARQRLDACRTVLAEHGLRLAAEDVQRGDFTLTGGRAAAQRLLEGGRVPRAIVALNDHSAIGAMEVLRQRGLRMPEDVALVGFDDVQAAWHLGLTSVRVPMRQMGREAGRLALNLLAGRAVESVTVETQLVVRRSCGCTYDFER